MGIKQLDQNDQANEAISKFKLLSGYGGPGSLIHTSYGNSVIISCIEEWGFLKLVKDLDDKARKLGRNDKERKKYVSDEVSMIQGMGISNDLRLLESFKKRKSMTNLDFLVLIPDIELTDLNNRIKDSAASRAINSSFLPKYFFDKNKLFRTYKKWYSIWVKDHRHENNPGQKFFPPKYNDGKSHIGEEKELTQDNTVLICNHGHMSDFPWSRFLRWRCDVPNGIHSKEPVDIFSHPTCCESEDEAKIRFSPNNATESGFDGKFLKCDKCKRSITLKGLMGLKIICPGHLPWESSVGDHSHHSGDKHSREHLPPVDANGCASEHMIVVLTTGNNLYFSRIQQSIYMPENLFKDDIELEITKLKKEKQKAFDEERDEDVSIIGKKIKELEKQLAEKQNDNDISEEIRDIQYKHQEFKALSTKAEDVINNNPSGHLKVKDVTSGLDISLKKYFSRVLRIDNMKLTSVQLDFSRVMPNDQDSESVKSREIFRVKNRDTTIAYPAVENFGEGIFFAFDEKFFEEFVSGNKTIEKLYSDLAKTRKEENSFSKSAIEHAVDNGWQLYLVHTFSHLIMRELEFKCGYPTASLSERLYISNEADYKMYGCLIYTTEGAEGSMGGLIAQTRPNNLTHLIKNAINRAVICSSDPLCWESEGQGLFDLNYASCFSCGLVSETSCELRNIYLDRKILVDENDGFFKDLID